MYNKLILICLAIFLLSCNIVKDNPIEGKWEIIGIHPPDNQKMSAPEMAGLAFANILSSGCFITFHDSSFVVSDSDGKEISIGGYKYLHDSIEITSGSIYQRLDVEKKSEEEILLHDNGSYLIMVLKRSGEHP